MTAARRRWRRRYAHSASRRREPVFAITAGLLVLALGIPVAYRALSDDSDDRTTTRAAAKDPTSTTSARSATSTTNGPGAVPHSTKPTTTDPTTSTAPIPRSNPGIRIRVVPAVRDIQIRVGGRLYTTASDGIVDVPGARGDVPVTYVGYSVSPPLQLVRFRSWSDGSTTANRSLDANGRGRLSLAIDIRYRVTVNITGRGSAPAGALEASSSAGSLTVTDGSQPWVLGQRGERSGTGVVARPITYSFAAPRGAPADERQRFTARPESLWVIRAP